MEALAPTIGLMSSKKARPKPTPEKATLIVRVDKELKREIRRAIAETDESMQTFAVRALRMLLAAERGRKRKET